MSFHSYDLSSGPFQPSAPSTCAGPSRSGNLSGRLCHRSRAAWHAAGVARGSVRGTLGELHAARGMHTVNPGRSAYARSAHRPAPLPACSQRAMSTTAPSVRRPQGCACRHWPSARAGADLQPSLTAMWQVKPPPGAPAACTSAGNTPGSARHEVPALLPRRYPGTRSGSLCKAARRLNSNRGTRRRASRHGSGGALKHCATGGCNKGGCNKTRLHPLFIHCGRRVLRHPHSHLVRQRSRPDQGRAPACGRQPAAGHAAGCWFGRGQSDSC